MSNTTTRYFALLDGKRGAYGVVFPDLPGCTAMGRTVDEALRNAAEAAIEWAQAVRETNNGRLPRPRPFETLQADPESKEALAHGASWVVVPLILDDARPAKANLSLDAGLLRAIDEAAQARGLTRSAFIASAAREKIVAEG
jgi:predicted RNase H-like HicB family nuclease